MYQSKIEAMPRELKDALLGIGDFETIDDIMPFEEKDSAKNIINQVTEALSTVVLPDYWIVAYNSNDSEYDSLFYFVFETMLAYDEEQKFYEALPSDITDQLGEESLRSGYSIY